MKNAVIILVVLGGVWAVMHLVRDSSVQAEEEKAAVDQSLLARVDALEDLISFHTHERELQRINERLQVLEASQQSDRPQTSSADLSSQSQATAFKGEFSKLKQDVQSLSSKLTALERSVNPLKQDIAKLKLSVTRVESSVARIDLRR